MQIDKRLYAEWSEAEKFGVFLRNKCNQVKQDNPPDIWSGKFWKLPDRWVFYQTLSVGLA